MFFSKNYSIAQSTLDVHLLSVIYTPFIYTPIAVQIIHCTYKATAGHCGVSVTNAITSVGWPLHMHALHIYTCSYISQPVARRYMRTQSLDEKK